MFQNNKIVFLIIAFSLMLILLYYNQNIQQNKVLESENSLNLLEVENSREKSKAEESEVQIIVHLAGAVKNAGVYKLNKSDRLVDLIKAAGGLRENADLAQINLAEQLYDGQKFTIPEIIKNKELKNNNFSEPQTVEETMIDNYSNSSNNDLININRADQNELEKLSGIGPAKAAAIIKYRDQNSYFSKKSDLLNISGIGEKTLENIKDEIVLQ
ncbi:MAG: helix-hairpin-helix domain-containing protein [Halanaerobium sp.]